MLSKQFSLHLYLIIALISASLAPAFASEKFSFKFEGKNRFYRIHVPKNYSKGKAVPLVIALHGGGGNMDIQAEDNFYKLISKSDSSGAIVAFPNGYSRFPRGKLATWNAGNCCALARDKNSNDVGFILEIIKRITNKLDISRVYAIGMSNGGMMAYRLACEASESFAGIASVTGTDNTALCQPKKAISVLHIHAKDDDHVLFNGGIGPGAVSAEKVTNYNSVPATIEKWAKLNNCQGKAKRIIDKAGAYCEQFDQCNNGTTVSLCVTETGGHSWPGGSNPRGKKKTSQALSATDSIWEILRI